MDLNEFRKEHTCRNTAPAIRTRIINVLKGRTLSEDALIADVQLHPRDYVKSDITALDNDGTILSMCIEEPDPRYKDSTKSTRYYALAEDVVPQTT